MADDDTKTVEDGEEPDAEEQSTDEDENAEFDAEFDKLAAEEAPADEARAEDPQDEDSGETSDDPAPSGDGDDQDAETEPGEKPGAEAGVKTGEKAASEEAADDIWKDAPPELRAAHEKDLAAARMPANVAHELASNRNRVFGLVEQNKRLQNQLKAQSGEDVDDDGTMTDDKWATFAGDYPEVAGPVEERYAALSDAAAKVPALEAKVNALMSERTETFVGDQEVYLAGQHSDWEKYSEPGSEENKALLAWLPGQPRSIQEALDRNNERIVDGPEAAMVLKLFKLDTGAGSDEPPTGDGDEANDGNDAEDGGTDQPSPTRKRRARQLKSGAAVHSRGAGAGSGPPDEFDSAFDHYAAQQEKEMEKEAAA